MRYRPRNLQARRRRWPLRLGLFLIYILVQYVASARITTTTTVIPSSSDGSTSESTESLFTSTEEGIGVSPTVSQEEIQAEKSKGETKAHAGTRITPVKNGVRDQSKEAAKEMMRKETETSSTKSKSTTTTTTTTTITTTTMVSNKRAFCVSCCTIYLCISNSNPNDGL